MAHEIDVLREPHGRLVGLFDPDHHGVAADHGIGHPLGLEGGRGSQQPVPRLFRGPFQAVECQKPIVFGHGDRKGAFVCETKQSVAKPEKDPLSVADPSAPKARRKSGTSVRGTAGWDDSMIAARGQAEGYVRALADDNPPFGIHGRARRGD